MAGSRINIMLVLKEGGDFSFQDVLLISRHINGKWMTSPCPHVYCLWDKVSKEYDFGNITLLPLPKNIPGTWSRIHLYSPEMEKYRPFLYIDLDTAIIKSVENLILTITNPRDFITLEDFWQKGQLATGLVWFPANCDKLKNVYSSFTPESVKGSRMDAFLRKTIVPDMFWQQLTNTIYDFKPRLGNLLSVLPSEANVVCFHGKPRIPTVANGSITIAWVKEYFRQEFPVHKPKVTVIIPYKEDRGWLKEAVASVPDGVQLILSQGEGNWPANFNKALPQATGDYIKFLHEDDMLTENSIEDSVNAIEEQGVDFIHGNAYELFMNAGRAPFKYIPKVEIPTVGSLKKHNTIHCPTLMYKKEIFEQLKGFDETLNNQEEYEFNLRCLQAGFKIGYCNSFLAWYRRHPKQKVRNISKEEIKQEKELVNKRYK